MALSLLILAAGMGSRFGGLKQIEAVGQHGEIIIDYSIYDARRAGFSQVVLVIRREHEKAFREIFDHRYPGLEVEYAFQDLGDLPEGFAPPPGREKPWGTGQAVYAARHLIKQPFAMINADDFYGADGYRILAKFLNENPGGSDFCLAGYELARTLSEFGTVSRGVCETDAAGNFVRTRELTKIARGVDGVIRNANADGTTTELTGRETVSMNLFGFTPALFAHLPRLFAGFLRENGASLKSEFYIPYAVNSLIDEGNARMRILPTSARWLGMTYREDKDAIVSGIAALVAAGEYPEKLF